MKTYLVHENDEPSENYCPILAESQQDAEMYFIGEYSCTPEDMDVTLVEYAPVKSCVWREGLYGALETECGCVWRLIGGTLKANNAIYCHRCGGVVTPVAYVVPGEGKE